MEKHTINSDDIKEEFQYFYGSKIDDLYCELIEFTKLTGNGILKKTKSAFELEQFLFEHVKKDFVSIEEEFSDTESEYSDYSDT